MLRGHVCVLLQHSGRWRDESAIACGVPTSRLRDVCDCLRLLTADTPPEALGVFLFSNQQQQQQQPPRQGDVVAFGGQASLASIEAEALRVSATSQPPPLATAVRRAVLALKCRGGSQARTILLLYCDESGQEDDLGLDETALAAARAAGVRLHVLSTSPQSGAWQSTMAACVRCDPASGACLAPLACESCGFCLVQDSAGIDTSAAEDDLACYGASAPTLPPCVERRVSSCEMLLQSMVLHSSVAELHAAWTAAYGDEVAFPLSVPPPPPSPLCTSGDTQVTADAPAEAALPAPALSCTAEAHYGELLVSGTRRSGLPPGSLRGWLRVVVPDSEEGSTGHTVINVALDAVAKCFALLTTPLCTVRAARMLRCFGTRPLGGPFKLAADPGHRHARARLALWLRDSGALELTYEHSAHRERKAELVLTIPPPQPEWTAAAAAAGRLGAAVRRIEADATGRSFSVAAGEGAGRCQRYFWLRSADVQEGARKLELLARLLQAPPTLSQLSGIAEDELALMRLAAPALISHVVLHAAQQPPAPRMAVLQQRMADVSLPPPPRQIKLPAPPPSAQPSPRVLEAPPQTPLPKPRWCFGGVDLQETEAQAEERRLRDTCCMRQHAAMQHAASPPPPQQQQQPAAEPAVKGAVKLSNLGALFGSSSTSGKEARRQK